MARRCEICGRGTVAGRNLPRKGLPKKKGGAGVHIGVKTKRTFKINLKSKKVFWEGRQRRMNICTRCLRTIDKKSA